ncbi:MAG: ComEC/Rec2 family competence protein [Candidatus Paceibacterota bacterium]
MIFSITIGFILGVSFGSYIWIGASSMLALFVLIFLILVYRIFAPKDISVFLICLILFISGFILGLTRIYFSGVYKQSELSSFLDRKIVAEGIVADEPDVRENSTRLTVRLSSVFDGVATTTVNEKIIAVVSIYPEYKYGDKLSLSLNLEEVESFEGNEGRIFNYPGYLRSKGIWYTAPFTQAKLISSQNGDFLKRNLFKIKSLFTASIEKVIPEPESSLLGGLLLGAKRSLGKDLLDKFNRVGVSHIVVLSGYNIAIVAKSIMSSLYFLPRQISLLSGVFGIILFIILSGAGTSAVRAGVMILLVLFLEKTNREHNTAKVLFATVVFMILWNPLILAFDPSFKLSVLATSGLIFLSPILSKKFSFVTERFGMREIVSSTVSAQIFVLPYILYSIGTLSFVSLPANLFILAFIPLTMLLGFITGILGFISIYIAFIPGVLTFLLLKYQLFIVQVADKVPFGSITIPSFSPIIVFLIYGIIFWWIKKTSST